MGSKFAVGDKVRCVKESFDQKSRWRLTIGEVYEVRAEDGDANESYGINLVGQTAEGYSPLRFEKVEPEVLVRRNCMPVPADTKDTNPKDAIAGAKVPLGLCSPIAEAHWAAAQYAGLTKYGAWNWRISGVRASVYIHALKRHIAGYISGETYDPIDGTRHLANIMACAAILLDAEAAGKLNDDRPPSVDHRPTYAEVEALMKKLQEMYADKTPRHYTIADTEK